jgi:acyl-homoserine-lactone acylase
VLFREWLAQYETADFAGKGRLFAVDFDPKDPVNTPRTLAAAGADGDLALENLARALQVLQSRGIAPDAPLGDLQYADKAGRRMPVHGGNGSLEGLMNMQQNSRNQTTLEPMDDPKPVKGSKTLTEKGYPVVHGSSFIMVLEFTDKGPRAKAFLTYSQSGDPKSPLFSDQTELFARKAWRPVLFEEEAIRGDTKRQYRVGSGPGVGK